MADRTPFRTILEPAQLDNVAQAIIALARELWVTVDRQCILEAVLAKHGLDVGAEIDAHEPDGALQMQLDARRTRLLAAITEALNGEAGDSA